MPETLLWNEKAKKKKKATTKPTQKTTIKDQLQIIKMSRKIFRI